jgi:hypothetical protein
VKIRRVLKWLVALIVVGVTWVVTGPTIWRDAIALVQRNLHTSRAGAIAIIVVPVGLLVLIVAFVRLRNWLRVRRLHQGAREDALRNLGL